MTSKIIQLSTKQCGRCQVAKKHIEKTLKNPNIEYEYVSLCTNESNKLDAKEYWKEVYENFSKYRKTFNINIKSVLPAFILKQGDSYKEINQEEVYTLIK